MENKRSNPTIQRMNSAMIWGNLEESCKLWTSRRLGSAVSRQIGISAPNRREKKVRTTQRKEVRVARRPARHELDVLHEGASVTSSFPGGMQQCLCSEQDAPFHPALQLCNHYPWKRSPKRDARRLSAWQTQRNA